MKNGKKIFLALAILVLPLIRVDSYAVAPEGEIVRPQDDKDLQAELSEINHQIDSLDDLKNFYTAKVERLKTKGDRLQFQGAINDAQNSWNRADEYQQIVERISGELEQLHEEKEEIEQQLQITSDKK